MNFKTHNDKRIDPTGTCYQGAIEAEYDHLTDCFGTAGSGDGYKVDAEWDVEFDDGTIATIYNWKNGRNYLGPEGRDVKRITDWHIGGATPRSVELVRIALDLHREKQQEPKTQFDKAIESSMDLRANLVAIRGEEFARAVEIGVLIDKQMRLVHFLSSGLKELADGYGDAQHEAVRDISASVNAKIMTHASSLLIKKDDYDAKEVIEWVERIVAAENKAADEIEKQLFKDN